jgi:CheY-like chemotaxis protein
VSRVQSSAAEVLIVDDDDDLRETLADSLLDYGLTVERARGGKEALAYVQANPAPRAIVLDLGMEGMDGAEVLERVRSLEGLGATDIIILTGQREVDEQRLLALGATRVLRKPVALLVLIAELTSARRRR